MNNQKFEGKVDKVKEIETKTADIEKKEEVVIVLTKSGETITFKGDEGMLSGFAPKMDVEVTISRVQKTLPESTKNKPGGTKK